MRMIVEDAELVVEHPVPHLRRDDGRNGPGNQNGGAHEAANRKLGVEHERHDQAEHRLDRAGDDREVDRIPDRLPPGRIGQEPDPLAVTLAVVEIVEVVLEADPLAATGHRQPRVGETQPDGPQQRPGSDREQHRDHRRQEYPGGTDLLAGKLGLLRPGAGRGTRQIGRCGNHDPTLALSQTAISCSGCASEGTSGRRSAPPARYGDMVATAYQPLRRIRFRLRSSCARLSAALPLPESVACTAVQNSWLTWL